MKRFAARRHKHPHVLGIPEIVEVIVARVKPRVIIIAFNVEHVEIAVRNI